MYSPDKFQNKTARAKPLQARGKERVRIILAAALELYKERSVEEVTTNDIAQRAGIPIGSLYRYYPNKDAITTALTELYVEDVSRLFDEVGAHPMLEYLSWEEILLLMVDGWVNYSRLNGPYSFLYAERARPQVREQTQKLWQRFAGAFMAVLLKRCPMLTTHQLLVCFRLCLAAADTGVQQEYIAKRGGIEMHHEMIEAVAAYMMRICPSSEHHTDRILS